MRPAESTVARAMWAGISTALLLAILGFGGFFVGMVILLGTDHSETYVDEWAPMWITGAVLGGLTALLAGRYDRRYLLWVAPLALVGVAASSMASTDRHGFPLLALGPMLAISLVLHAWTGRDSAPGRFTVRHLWTGAIATLVAALIVGATSIYVVVRSQPTPSYEAMRTDPMAAESLPGMEVKWDWSKDNTTPLGMPSAAEVSRLWIITDGSNGRAKVKELEALAVSHGWNEETNSSFCGWQKTVDDHPLCLVIRKGHDAGEVIVEITLQSE